MTTPSPPSNTQGLGPEDLSFSDIAAILSDVLGRPISFSQTPFDAFQAQLLQGGMPEDFVQAFIDMMKAKNEGMDNQTPRSAASIGPTTFREWAETTLKPVV